MLADLLSLLNEDTLMEWMERYRSWGPFPGLLLPFLKSFVPPLPTMVIVGWNAVVYGLWLGFLYTWIGMVAGCLVTFGIVRKIAEHPIMVRWRRRPKVARAMHWIRKRAFSYVFLLSLLPVGPFVVVNTAAGLAGMNARSFALAVSGGKAIMIFTISYFGHDLSVYYEQPWRLLFVLLLVAASFIASKRIDARFSGEATSRAESA